MLPQEIIRTKRDRRALSPDIIAAYVDGVTSGRITDAQIAAFSMAALLNGLDAIETALLTRAMAHSGTVLNWPDIGGPVIDKHSTGGVGDKVSLMLAPMAAACGLYVPMIAGRGLGHTGGTIDKLDCIPGFRTDLSIADFQNIVRNIGCAIIGQTAEFAPADKRIYAVRDVTGTVESVPLITASILSKKLAAGLQGLVLDVKCGNGAFMQHMDDAKTLADSLQRVGQEAGLRVVPIITDMNQILGHTAGNAVEVFEAIDYLNGTCRAPRLHDITLTLCAEMLVLGGLAATTAEGRAKAQQVLDSGLAAEKFSQMIAAQGGPQDLLQQPEKYLPRAPIVIDVIADRSGMLQEMDTGAIGWLLVNLHAGRARVEDIIDPSVGITDMVPLGTVCNAGQTRICRLHLRDEQQKQIAVSALLQMLAFTA